MERCNCENIGAGCSTQHEAGACPREGIVKVIYLGKVCGQCASFIPAIYHHVDSQNGLAANVNRRPEPWVTVRCEEGTVHQIWKFPRGMRDAEIRAEVERQGFDTASSDHRCESGCCGRKYHHALRIQQHRAGKRAELYSAYCC